MEQAVEPTRVVCPECGTVYRVNRSAAELARARVKCKKCGATFTPAVSDGAVSAPSSPPPSPPAAAAPPAAPPPVPNPAPAAPAARAPAPPAPSAPGGPGDPFERLEEYVGELNRALYMARQASASAVPEAVVAQAQALGDVLVEAKRQQNILKRGGKDLETLLEVSQTLNQEHELSVLLERIMDYAIPTLNAKRGFLMLRDEGTGALEVRVARGMGGDLDQGEARVFSTGVASRVAAEGTPFFTANSKGDTRTAGFASVMRSDARAILCAPVNYKDRNLGTLYVDNQAGAPGFTQDLVRLAQSFASAAAGALENARLYQNIQEETRKRSSLSRYLSPAIVEDILKQGDELVLGGSTVECSVLFSDVVGFTPFSEALRPDELVALLNEYFTLMAEMIFKNNGTLDKFIGDATMAVFGAPVFEPNHPAWAVKAALDMIAAADGLMEKWKSEGKPTFKMRVGVNSGPVVAGNLGSPQRMDYTVIGDAVNLANRMESVAKHNSVAVSASTWEKIKDYAQGEALGPVKVKGKAEEVPVYLVTSIQPPSREVGQIKRATPRADVELFAIYVQEGISGTRQGIIRNISAGGALIQTSFPADAGNSIRLNFTIPGGGPVKDLAGHVVRATWIEEAGRKGYKVNLQFLDIGEEPRSIISQYVAKKNS